MITDKDFDRRILPPIHANMTFDQRVAAWNFLNACEVKAELILASLQRIPEESRPHFHKRTVDYWNNVVGGIRWSKKLLGLAKEQTNATSGKSV